MVAFLCGVNLACALYGFILGNFLSAAANVAMCAWMAHLWGSRR